MQELEVISRHVVQRAAIRLQRCIASIAHPRLEPAFLVASIEHHDFMIAPKWDKFVRSAEFDNEVQYGPGIRPAIHVVAQRNDRVILANRDKINKRR